jgi:hypothetical protein
MSMVINSITGGESPSLLMINDHFQIIHIYLLWSSNNDDEFKIQAIFGKNLNYNFEPVDRFRSDHKLETIIYRLEYHMPIIDDDRTTSNEINNNTINKYHLRMSTKVNYDDLKPRTININQPYQFVFDVQFQNNFLPISKRMIENLSKLTFFYYDLGRVDEFWNQLCLYTYFLIKSNMHEQFNYIIEQFKHELSTDNTRKLSQHFLNVFFHTCYTYLPQINYQLKENENAMKIFLQMFGLLPIEKDNLKFDNTSLSLIASEFFDYITMHLENLLQTTNHNDWILLSKGLTVFMTAQMLGSQTPFNTFILIEQMKNDPEKQELVVNFLLRRLIEFQVPIKNDTWTNLFPLTTDKDLLINCLNLVASLDNYFIALQHIIKHNTINESMKLQLTMNFDRSISRTDFIRKYFFKENFLIISFSIVSLENILSLLTYLQPQYRPTTSSSIENIHLFQLIIKSSHSLRQKINSCLENLDINRISLESLCELFQLDHSVSILVIDKTNYLIKTIINHHNRTENFYTTWFICFLCDKYYQNNGNEQQNFQRLLKIWLDYIKNDRDMLPQIIAKLDMLFDHLQNIIRNDDDDYRLTEFLENMITTVFQPSKSIGI